MGLIFHDTGSYLDNIVLALDARELMISIIG